MTSGSDLTLDEFVARWHNVPFSDDISDAARRIAALVGEELQEQTTVAFYALLMRVTREFFVVLKRPVQEDGSAIGQASQWLEGIGLLAELHDAFVAGMPNVANDTVTALRDSCLAELRINYHRYLLSYHCPTWEQRCALVEQWLATRSAAQESRQPWELVDALEDILESFGEGARLAAQLRSRSPIKK